MRKKRRAGVLLIVFISIFFLISNLRAEVVDEEQVKEAAASAFIHYRLALELEGYAWAFSLEPRFIQKESGNVENYKKTLLKPWAVEWRRLCCQTEIEKTEVLTPKRVAILVSSQDERMARTGFYILQEDGKWKVGCFEHFFRHTKRELEKLKDAIVRYYQKNERLPEVLSELLPEYVEVLPTDIFNDKTEPYGYLKGTNGDFTVYSYGPDSDDDLGAVEYNYESGLLSDGDIIRSQ